MSDEANPYPDIAAGPLPGGSGDSWELEMAAGLTGGLNPVRHPSVIRTPCTPLPSLLATPHTTQMLVHDLLLIEAWKAHVYPLLAKHLAERVDSVTAYLLLYHEVTVANLLQVGAGGREAAGLEAHGATGQRRAPERVAGQRAGRWSGRCGGRSALLPLHQESEQRASGLDCVTHRHSPSTAPAFLSLCLLLHARPSSSSPPPVPSASWPPPPPSLPVAEGAPPA